MSLDITFKRKVKTTGLSRKNGKEITVEEMLKAFPDYEPETEEVWWRNITHNVGSIAAQVPIKEGITPNSDIQGTNLYQILWHPTAEMFSKKNWEDVQPKDYVYYLETAAKYMSDNIKELSKLNPENGWGSAAGLLEYVKDMLKTCKLYPKVDIINISV